MATHTIDQEGGDGQWRVWWSGPNGHNCERHFNSKESAEKWAAFVEDLESEGSK